MNLLVLRTHVLEDFLQTDPILSVFVRKVSIDDEGECHGAAGNLCDPSEEEDHTIGDKTVVLSTKLLMQCRYLCQSSAGYHFRRAVLGGKSRRRKT